MGIFDFFKKKKTELKGEEKPNKSEDSKPKEEVKPSELDTKSTSESLEGKTIVITGVFENHSRDELKKMIESKGGKASSSVTKNTAFILSGSNMGPKKKLQAEELGIQIIGEDEFTEEYIKDKVKSNKSDPEIIEYENYDEYEDKGEDYFLIHQTEVFIKKDGKDIVHGRIYYELFENTWDEESEEYDREINEVALVMNGKSYSGNSAIDKFLEENGYEIEYEDEREFAAVKFGAEKLFKSYVEGEIEDQKKKTGDAFDIMINRLTSEELLKKSVKEDVVREKNALLKDALIYYNMYSELDFIVKPSLPILYFGDINAYFNSNFKVITAALNPSDAEFKEFKNSSPSYIRFPEYDNTIETLQSSLNNYF